ncbi:cell wall-binding repeat-containing protein [Rossellomorea aquimaris]|uniref:cell wall-binding repeat-containing protein n=1 Tax=Rossellomorea aquimaris TaxID=189382 RepID=UPI001CD5C159|nr:cell wall-binding repeat-containing protein [Rossellomorea aquimaris]MCA1060818.1 cell wall-binding repeat-containing protein [Rossellomorea aquimaris]
MKTLFVCIIATVLSFSMILPVSAESNDTISVESIKQQIEKFPKQSTLKKIESEQFTYMKETLMKNQRTDKISEMGEVFEQEPNDTLEQADNVLLEDIALGSFWWAGDLDLYRLNTTKEQDIYLVGTTFSALNDLGFALVNSSGEVLYPSDGIIDGSDKLLVYYSMPPGEYYIAALDLNEYGAGGTYGLSAFSGDDKPGDTERSFFRISGKDRYETAIEISRAGWPEGADNVVLARDNTFPDALAGAPLAYQMDAPILLNPKDKLHPGVMNRIKELGARKVIILGGEGAISGKVQTQLEQSGLEVKRIGGQTRYETAAKIAAELGYYSEAIIAYGDNFPDALSIASYAAFNRIPILLTPRDTLDPATRGALVNVTDTIIVGGKAVISSSVEKQLSGKNPYRISGSDRYETSVQIATKLGMPGEMITIATGQNFADALTGSVLAAKYFEPIILVEKNSVPASVLNYIDANGTWYYTILGGEGAVSDKVVDQLYSH